MRRNQGEASTPSPTRKLKLPQGYVPNSKGQSLVSSYFSPAKQQSQSAVPKSADTAPEWPAISKAKQADDEEIDVDDDASTNGNSKAIKSRPLRRSPRNKDTADKQKEKEIVVDDDEDEVFDREEEDSQKENKRNGNAKSNGSRRATRATTSSKKASAAKSSRGQKRKRKAIDSEDEQEEEEEEEEEVVEDEDDEWQPQKRKASGNDDEDEKYVDEDVVPDDFDDLEEEPVKKKRRVSPRKTAAPSASSSKRRAVKAEADEEDVNGDEEAEEEEGEGDGKKVPKGKVGEGGKLEGFVQNETRHREFVKRVMQFEKSNSQAALSAGTNISPKKRKAAAPKKGAIKYTPLEQQVLAVRAKYPDTMLLVECGYRFRFFGEDAEIAAKVLNIVAFPSHNFMTASVPTHRLLIHVRRLIEAGHKVGVVSQTETAALKAAGTNKGQPFTRELTALYTKATFIPDDMQEEDCGAAQPNFLLCIHEMVSSLQKDKVHISIVGVQLQTGDIVYDDFDDHYTREELETRLLHLRPTELLVPSVLSAATENLIRRVCPEAGPSKTRIQVVDDETAWDYDNGILRVTEFYDETVDRQDEEGEPEAKPAGPSPLSIILGLPRPVVVCLGVLVNHLSVFGLDSALHLTGNFRHFTSESAMLLPGTSVRNLELFQNTDTGESKGSLFWLLNHTLTSFGARQLRKWIEKPLLDSKAIEARLDCVEELMAGTECAPCILLVFGSLNNLPDLERGLAQCHYQKCGSQNFLSLLRAFQKVSDARPSTEMVKKQVKSSCLRDLLLSFPDVSNEVEEYLSAIDATAAADGRKNELFITSRRYPEVNVCNDSIVNIEKRLDDHLVDLRKKFKRPTLSYNSVSQNEYLVELPRSVSVPEDWIQIGSTKAVYRYHTPIIHALLGKLAIAREKLQLAANNAWTVFLGEFKEKYGKFHQVMRTLATLDCLNALANVARSRPGYVRPQLVSEPTLIIEEGRHPVVEAVMSDSGDTFVPNSIAMGSEDGDMEEEELEGGSKSQRCMIITGPNMGGKTSYIKQTALLVVLAQIGSFVPAQKIVLCPFDGIYTRMGASDDIQKGQSTFFVELSETSSILQRATPRSLVILDELGRGTSTHDGVAIAYATLEHIVRQTKCITLFVTHYPLLAQLEETYPRTVGNFHMAFFEEQNAGSDDTFGDTTNGKDHMDTDKDAAPNVTFLYKLTRGAAKRSYGLNVAKLAELPNEVLAEAAVRSKELEDHMKEKQRKREQKMATLRELNRLLAQLADADVDEADTLAALSALQNQIDG